MNTIIEMWACRLMTTVMGAFAVCSVSTEMRKRPFLLTSNQGPASLGTPHLELGLLLSD